MKKAMSIAFLMICLFVIYQFGVTFFKQSHEIQYTLKKDSRSFLVHEKFYHQRYYIEIHSDDYTFFLEQDNSFNKMKQIVEDIEFVEEAGMMCIYPDLKNQELTTVVCSDQKKMYAYESVRERAFVSNFVSTLQKDGKFRYKEVEEVEEHNGQITYYTSAMDEFVSLWFYQGFSIFNSERSLFQSTLSFDRYENTLSRFVGKYYVTPQYTDNKLYEFSSFYVFDVTTNANFTIELDEAVSNYSYVNGIVDDKLYIFDKNLMKQIEVHPAKKTARVVASGNEDALYYHGEWETRNIYDFSQNKIAFLDFDDTKLKEKYQYISAYYSNRSYYFYDGSGFYQVYEDFSDTPMLLFEQAGIKDIKVVDGYIYYILGDTLYKYTPGILRKRIMKYDEFLYNSSMLYDIYRD